MLLHRQPGDTGIPPITAPWPTKDIVYVAVVGGVMLAALLEWILWLLAFLYCLYKVVRKANGEGRWGIRILCLINMIFFIGMRCIFLPIMIVTLPLPPQVVQYFPLEMVSVLQWFAFWSFAGLLTIPWLFCVYQLVTHNVGRERRIKTVLDEYSAPKVVIIMPCYNEEPEILLRTVDSLVDCEYPPSCLHIFLSFDGDAENELYLNTIDKLGVPLTLDSYPRSIDVTYRSCRITVSRFPHGGKRSCQKRTFRLIDKVYAEYLRRNDNLFLLFIDSDCILDKFCIQNFMYEMELKPGSKHNMLAMTGVITSTTTKNTLITVLQDMEYVHGQLFERSVESGCGAVTCLPGALTILRFSAFRKMAKYYFADKAEQCDDLFDYGKCHLGEDRWLTHLFMIGAQERYQIQMNTGAFCKTEAVQTFKSLLKQRRRWFLGFITNEVCMLTDVRLWRRYPLLLLIRLAQNTIRTTALLFFIMVISIITTSQKIANLPVGFIAVSLGLNWVLMLYFGAKLGRYKIMLYPLMFVVNPFFNWLYMVYGIFTAGQRTWGGPRADAGKADETTTVAEAIAQAEAQGDELNVVPETFRAQAHAHATDTPPATPPLLPASHLQGRFAPATELPGGWYQQTNDSGVLCADMTRRSSRHQDDESQAGILLQRRQTNRRQKDSNLPRRDSAESIVNSRCSSRDSSIAPPPTPRRVESLLNVARDDDTSTAIETYRERQAQQKPPGGAFFERIANELVARPQTNLNRARHNSEHVIDNFDDHLDSKVRAGGAVTAANDWPPTRPRSVASDAMLSDASGSMHFGFPSCKPTAEAGNVISNEHPKAPEAGARSKTATAVTNNNVRLSSDASDRPGSGRQPNDRSGPSVTVREVIRSKRHYSGVSGDAGTDRTDDSRDKSARSSRGKERAAAIDVQTSSRPRSVSSFTDRSIQGASMASGSAAQALARSRPTTSGSEPGPSTRQSRPFQPAHNSTARTGRSPLARRSFTRVAGEIVNAGERRSGSGSSGFGTTGPKNVAAMGMPAMRLAGNEAAASPAMQGNANTSEGRSRAEEDSRGESGAEAGSSTRSSRRLLKKFKPNDRR